VTEPATGSAGEPEVGASFGPYRIEASLGVGGMGRVYKAIGPDGKRVALKTIKPELADDTVFLRRFEREVGIAQRISHPNLVPVLDSGQHAGIAYMTQSFIGGGALDERLEREVRLAIETAVRICAEVAGALDALHSAGLVHRDVKPANILLDEADVAFITDFGLVKDSQGSRLTAPGHALGSLDYMAPEQMRSDPVSPASDVYGLASVMYECVAGRPPFGDRQGTRLIWAALQEQPADPLTERSDLPAAVGAVVLGALAKDPKARPQSASGFAQTLAEAAGL
jgi:serine/threonine protein kinase